MSDENELMKNIDERSEEASEICRRYALLEPLLTGYLEGRELSDARERARIELGWSKRTLRRKIKLLKDQGMACLIRKARKDKGVERKVTSELMARVLETIRENPDRSVRKALVHLREDEKLGEKAACVSAAAVYSHLVKAGVDLKKLRAGRPEEPKRSFEADFANELWQGDSRSGITLPDLEKPPRRLGTKLFVWLDDHSRLLLFGRYYFDETLPHLEASFRQALLRYGLPRRLYCDNGSTYISRHFTFVTHALGVNKIHHPPYCAWCKGKIEAFNKHAKRDFQSEAGRAGFKTLEELNSAFDAWSELEYNRRLHSETGETPRERYAKSIARVGERRITDLEGFERLFLWRAERVVDKYGLVSFEGNEFRAERCAVGERLMIRYNPFDLSSIELWRGKIFVGVAKANKVERIKVKSMPEEHKNENANEVLRSSQRYFAKLRERLMQERARGADAMDAFWKLKEKQKGETHDS